MRDDETDLARESAASMSQELAVASRRMALGGSWLFCDVRADTEQGRRQAAAA
jgi:hypothetical protein